MKATEVTAGLAESNGSLLPGLWRDSLHVTCGLTACTPGSAPGPTLGNEYGKTLPNVTFTYVHHAHARYSEHENAVKWSDVINNTLSVQHVTADSMRCCFTACEMTVALLDCRLR